MDNMRTVDYSQWPDISAEHPYATDEAEKAYIQYIVAREYFYTHFFGECYPKGMIIKSGDPNLIANWPSGGVYKFAPNDKLKEWHYVTSGLSQLYSPEEVKKLPKDEIENMYSAWGHEFVISSKDHEDWPSEILFFLVKHFVLDNAPRRFQKGSRIPLGGPIKRNTKSKLDHLVCTFSGDYPADVLLPGGHCEMLHVTGVTTAEVNRAKQWGPGPGGSTILTNVLQRYGIGLVSIPDRDCLTTKPDFNNIWRETEDELESEWKTNGWTGEGKANS